MADIILFGNTPSRPTSWVGRTVMLNISVAPKFQTKGLSLSRNNAIACVPPDIIEQQIQNAIEQGILLDITETNVKGLKLKDTELSPVKDLDKKEFPVFTGKDSTGNTYFITPKDEADHQRMLAEIRETGGLRIPKQDAPSIQGTEFSPIYSKPVPTNIEITEFKS